MELKAKDTYRIEATGTLNPLEIESLWNAYLGLSDAVTIGLYSLLFSEANAGTTLETHGHLCTLLNLRIEQLEEHLLMLQRIGLLSTYVRRVEDHQDFIHRLLPPLRLDEVLVHEAFGRALYKKLGNDAFEQLRLRFVRPQYDKSGFTETTAKFDAQSLSSWNQEHEAEFLDQRTQIEIQPLTHLTFDLRRFLRTCSTVVFPLEMRTQDVLVKIEEWGSVFGIGEDEMIRLVGRSVNYTEKKINLEQLRRRITKEPLRETKLPEDPYQWPPVLFLKEKQGGIEPVDADKRLLTRLVSELRLNPDVVNVLIEHILAKNNQRLSKAYVEKVAVTWSRLKITTVEEALKELENEQGNMKSGGKKKREDVLPQEVSSDRELTDEEKRRIIAKMKSLGGNDE